MSNCAGNNTGDGVYNSPRTPPEDEGVSTIEHHRLDPGRFFPREAILKSRRISLRVGNGGGAKLLCLRGAVDGAWLRRRIVFHLCSLGRITHVRCQKARLANVFGESFNHVSVLNNSERCHTRRRGLQMVPPLAIANV